MFAEDACGQSSGSGCLAGPWPAPRPLEGVKSNKRPVFEIRGAEFTCAGGANEASGISLCLSSRIAAIGEAGRAAVAILLGEAGSGAGEVWRHDALGVVHLAPKALAGGRCLSGGYLAAIEVALQERPQVVVLDEALPDGDAEWAKAFHKTLCSEALRSFHGAVVVAVADETRALAPVCSQSWVGHGVRVRQEPYLEVIEDALDEASSAADLLEEALSYDYCNLAWWVDAARAKNQKVTLFASRGVDGKRTLRGFLCHHVKEGQAELHIRFIFVPKELRGSGLGARVVRWVIATANRMPQSECRWISLKAADASLVPWYEKFGFTDMTCGQCDDEDEVWMELPNDSIVVGNEE
uniref:N-acetyltransferase domain-containing protein n=1 Tax=Alexandrium monilatum TaxID=311494 RepID=A0A7S4Q256_9DINO